MPGQAADEAGPDVVLGREPLTWDAYEKVVYQGAQVALDPANRMAKHRDELERQIANGAVIYAVNTGW